MLPCQWVSAMGIKTTTAAGFLVPTVQHLAIISWTAVLVATDAGSAVFGMLSGPGRP